MRAAVILAILLGLSTSASAANPHLDAARKAYQELRFEDALEEVQAARRAGGLTREEDIELTRLEATVYAIFDDEPRSVAAFHRLLELDPTFTLPRDTSPKIRRYFERARARVGPPPTPRPPRERRREPAPPFYASGWFWGALAGAAAVGLGAGVLFVDDGPRSPRGNLGTLDLP